MEKKIPLSRMAMYKGIIATNQTIGLQMGWLILVVIGAFFLLIGFVLDKNYPVGFIIFGAILLLAGLAVFRLYFKKAKLLNQELEEKNLKDWNLSQKIIAATNNLPEIISNKHAKIVVPGLQTINNLKPVRIEYLPLQELEGELKGTFQGFGLFGFKGSMAGKIKGTSIPEPTNENVVIICADEKGDSLRLVCLSPTALRRKVLNFLQAFANQEYGERSHTETALFSFWNNPNSLAGILKNLNPQRVYDYLVVKLELPKEKRPNISVNGITTKKGILLVSSISCDNKKEEIIPVELMERVKIVLEKILEKPIPQIPLLE